MLQLAPEYKLYKYVHLIGIELEGGFNNPCAFLLEHDGSVSVDADLNGEIPSPPLKPKDVPQWMNEHYPDAVNVSCGMHVHVSLRKPYYYARLMEPEFHTYIKDSLTTWGKKVGIRDDHPFWPRLRGENRYCLDQFYPELQVSHRDKSDSRYTQLNYTWARYRTIECRVLPAFVLPEIGIAAVYAVVDSFERFLRENKPEPWAIEDLITPKDILVESNEIVERHALVLEETI